MSAVDLIFLNQLLQHFSNHSFKHLWDILFGDFEFAASKIPTIVPVKRNGLPMNQHNVFCKTERG